MASIARPIMGSSSSETRTLAHRTDWWLVLSTVLLMAFGLMSLYSVGGGFAGHDFKKQLGFAGIGLIPFAIFAFVHPKVWRKGVNWLYVMNVLLLISVFVIGKHTKGAERWIQLPGIQFQPSELAKILTVLTVATFYSARQESIQKLSTFLLGLAHVLVPVILIRMQPHLGAAVSLFIIWFGISIVAGVPAKYLGACIGVVFALFLVAWNVPSLKAKVFPAYQLSRGEGFAGTKDHKGKNYQTDRAEIAFGVGGVMGSGFMKGEQKAGGFIPEQQTDFIVSVVGEEGGLIGCSILLFTYAFFFYRVFLVMLHAQEPYYKMIAAGIFAVLGFHTFVNIAMVLQLVPVVGLWLPFLSYGGTAMWLCMASVGLLLNVRRRERPILF